MRGNRGCMYVYWSKHHLCTIVCSRVLLSFSVWQRLYYIYISQDSSLFLFFSRRISIAKTLHNCREEKKAKLKLLLYFFWGFAPLETCWPGKEVKALFLGGFSVTIELLRWLFRAWPSSLCCRRFIVWDSFLKGRKQTHLARFSETHDCSQE